MYSRLPLFRMNLFLILSILIFSTEIEAQAKAPRAIVVKTEPAGALVSFEGENNFVGITPFEINSNFHGRYKIVVTKQGYEKRNYEFLFDGKRKGTLKLKLTPKKAYKAGLRSCFFTGWGQMYSERKTFGAILGIAQVGALIGTANSTKKYQDKVDELNDAKREYEKNKRYYNLRETLRQKVETKYSDADKAFQNQQTWILIAGGIWLYNVLDSMLFFPSFEDALLNRSMPTISSDMSGDKVGIKLSLSF